MTLEDVSLEQAIRLIEDRIAAGGGKAPKKPAKKAPAKKPAARKTSDKKPAVAAKKPAAKVAKAKTDIVDSDEAPFEGGVPGKKAGNEKDGSQEVGAPVRPERSDFGRMARTLAGQGASGND